jgi:hypothetical protein
MLLAVNDESLEPPQPPDDASNKTEDSILCGAIENGDSMNVVS